MVHEQKFKDLLSSTCQVSVERIVLDLESEAMRGPGSIPTGGNILSLEFVCFHIVKTKMSQLAFLCVCEKPCKVGFAASFIFTVLFSITIPFYFRISYHILTGNCPGQFCEHLVTFSTSNEPSCNISLAFLMKGSFLIGPHYQQILNGNLK